MKIIEKNNLKILIADEDKKIRAINDIYKPASETETEYIPYYCTKIYLPISFDNSKLNDIYVEKTLEEIENEKIVIKELSEVEQKAQAYDILVGEVE